MRRPRNRQWSVWRFYLAWLTTVGLLAAILIGAGYGLTALAVYRWAP